MQSKSFRINSKTTIHITASDKQSDLDQPLYAINWFNTKSKKLYNLYAALAFPHVKKVGGEVVFKGKVKDTLSGNKTLKRESLLIIKYPNADSFLGLFSQKMFLIKSLLRIKAVKDFVFGFVKMNGGSARSTSQPEKYMGDKSYLVHILKGKPELEIKIDDIQAGINVFFDRQKAAYVGRSTDDGEIKQGPFFIDRIIIWEASDESILKDWLEHSSYFKELENRNNYSFYFVNRLL